MLKFQIEQKKIEIEINGVVKTIPVNSLTVSVSLKLSSLQESLDREQRILNKSSEDLKEETDSEIIKELNNKISKSQKNVLTLMFEMFKISIPNYSEYEEIFDSLEIGMINLVLNELIRVMSGQDESKEEKIDVTKKKLIRKLRKN
jgi:glutamyl-tRNA reductase